MKFLKRIAGFGAVLLLASMLVACSGGSSAPSDPDPDRDGDGVPNGQDAFPDDPTETVDTDGDGIGDNADPDDDNDSVDDVADVDDDNNGLIELFTLQQLDWVRNDLQGTSLDDGSNPASNAGCPMTGCNGYEQMADWDFDTNGDGAMDAGDDWFDYDGDGSNNGWLPIGDSTTPFQANFSGNGLRISNLFIDRQTGDAETAGGDLGLFGHIGGATLANDIAITGVHFDGALASISGQSNAGSLAGRINSNSAMPNLTLTLADISSGATVNCVNTNAGGLFGDIRFTPPSHGFTADRLTFTGSVANGSNFTGGIAGELELRNGTTTMNDILVDADIDGAAAYNGGLFGQIDVYAGSLALDGVSIAGSIDAGGSYSGGLAGYMWVNDDAGFDLQSFSNSAAITGSNYVAGLFAYLEYEGELAFDDLVNSGEITATGDAGGLLAYVEGYDGTPGTSFVLTDAINTGDITAGGTAGGVAGELDNNGGPMTITDISSSGAITSTGNFYVGGTLGYLYAENIEAVTTVTRAFGSGDVSANNSVGGLIGWVTVRDAASLTVTDSGATGSVSGVNDVGGFIGQVDDQAATAIHINASFATGDVTATGTSAGGFAGIAEQARIEASFSTGSVNGDEDVGGFVGHANTGTLIDASFTASPVGGNSNVGAFAGSSTDAAYSTSHYVDAGGGPPKIANLVSGADPMAALAGYTLAQLQCPLAANDTGCTGVTVYDEWQLESNSDSDPAWNFGTTAELPGLSIGGTVYRDADGDGNLD